MTILFHAHSGLRYLVLLAAAVAVVAFLWGRLSRRPYGRSSRIVMAAFVGLVDLQVLLGAGLWLGGRRPAGILGHAGPMLLAAGVLHVASARARRREESAGHGLPLAGTLVAVALIVGGILAIRDAIL